MNVRRRWRELLVSLSAVIIVATSTQITFAGDDKKLSLAEQGKIIAYDRKKGNCLACHVIGDGEMPGNIAPPLMLMKARFPKKERLRAQIWDATVNNPYTAMPPFGRHKIISDQEIDAVVEFLYGL